MSEQWWADEDVDAVVMSTMKTAIAAFAKRKFPGPDTQLEIALAALATVAPTVERIRREAKAEALRDLARDLSLCAECADEADLKADEIEVDFHG